MHVYGTCEDGECGGGLHLSGGVAKVEYGDEPLDDCVT